MFQSSRSATLRICPLPPQVLLIASPPSPKRHPYNQWAPDARALDIVGDKWTLLIVRDLATGSRRFVELQRVLPGISTEQLRSRLNRMVADELLTRERFREVPPRVEYELTERGVQLLAVVSALARWGCQWAWGEPSEGEALDIGAILRSLAESQAPSDLDGVVAVTVIGDVGAANYAVSAADCRFAIVEGSAHAPGASISGPETAWVAALSPRADDSGLAVDGDARLAEGLLRAITPSAGQHMSIR